MRLSKIAATVVLVFVAAACGRKDASPTVSAEVAGLKSPDAFTKIKNKEARGSALFLEMAKVIQHPRCLNCHPREGGPLQGDAMIAHAPPVVRGPADNGPPGMECTTCHGATNVDYLTGEGSIPGNDPWHLAPASTGWIGLSAAEICAQIKDPERNGGKSLADLVEHNAKDSLVGWGWNPGTGRTPAPGDQATFGALTAAWVEAGAACPKG